MIRKFQATHEVALRTPTLLARKLVSAEDSTRLSVTHMTIDGAHPRVSMEQGDVVYFVIEGDGWFRVGDGAAEQVSSNDTVLVPAGTPFEYGGALRYLNIQSPPFVQSQVNAADAQPGPHDGR